MDYNESREKAILGGVGFITVLMIAGLIYYAFTPTPPPKSIEEIRAERADKFHEAGKDGQAFIKGLVGK